MTTEDDPQRLSRALDRETDELERQGQEVKEAIQGTREEWERKRRDENVPGALPPQGDAPEDDRANKPEDDPGPADDA
jgi:hypothetical protein